MKKAGLALLGIAFLTCLGLAILAAYVGICIWDVVNYFFRKELDDVFSVVDQDIQVCGEGEADSRHLPHDSSVSARTGHSAGLRARRV